MISHVHMKGTQHTGSQKVHHLLQLLQQGPGSCTLFNKTIFTHVHRETATYRKPEGASPAAAVAAGTWRLPPVQQDNVLTCIQRGSNTQEGAAPSAAVAAGTWQLQPVQQNKLLTCPQRDHKETATYRKPEGASPSAAVAAGTWQLPPVQQDHLHTCTQRDSNIQEARRCITCCSCCSSDLAAAAISTRHCSLMCTKKKQCTGTQKVHQLLQLLQQVTGSCSLFNRTNFSHVHNETATYRKP